MKTLRRLARQAVFFLLAVAVALIFHFRTRVPGFSIGNHAYRPEAGPLLLAAGLVFLLLIGLWALVSQVWTKNSRLSYKESLALDFPTYLPLAFLALTPLALTHYLTRDDLAERLGLWSAAVVAAVLYLKFVRVLQADREGKATWGRTLDLFIAWPLRRRLAVLFLSALVLYNGGALLLKGRGVAFGGDEPHYLMIAHSLVTDGDLDLANNYAEEDFRAYEPEGTVLRPHVVPGRKEGGLYSMHSPGLAFLLLPFYGLGLALGRDALFFLVRFGMSLFGVLLGLQMYLYARAEWGREKLALGLWALFAFTAPVFFHSIHVYPEIVAALFAFYVFRKLRFSSAFRPGELALLGLLLASLVWFHALKYFFVQAPLVLFAFREVWRKGEPRERLGRLAAFLGPAAVLVLVYFGFQNAVYGSINPTAVSWQGAMDGKQSLGFLKDILTGIPFRFRWETLAGYFLDQRDGLLLYAPAFAFGFVGLTALLRRKASTAGLILFVAAPYVLVSAFLAQRTGYAPQARPLVAVVWAGAILVGHFLAEGGRPLLRRLFAGAAALSVLMVWLLLRNPFALYQETTSGVTERAGDLFISLSNLHVYLPSLLPSFLKVEDRWAPNLYWIAALVVLAAAALLPRRRETALSFGAHASLAGVLLAGFFALYVLFPRAVLMSPRPVVLPDGERWTFYSLSRVALMESPAKFSIRQDDRDYNFYFTTDRPLAGLEVEYGSPAGDYRLEFSMFDHPVFDETTAKESRTKLVDFLPAYDWKGRSLYRVSIRLEKRSDVRTAVTPYAFGLRPAR